MDPFTIPADQAGATLAAVLRILLPDQSWRQVKHAVSGRRVKVNDELCLDPARRLKSGDTVGILGRPERLHEAFTDDLTIRHLDDHVVVVEKPSGINTVRHPDELTWKAVRRGLSPTLEDRLRLAIANRLRQPVKALATVRKVHRLDKLTSGLVVFARSHLAERMLGRQFRAHTVDRQYMAIVRGQPKPGTIRTWLARDRGDGRRGSSKTEGNGKLAVTHLVAVKPVGEFSIVTCRLETGRTHQIRIHLSEHGFPVCGDPVYHIRKDGTRVTDDSGAPRLALHAELLGFAHPATGTRVRWEMRPPTDLQQFIQRITPHGNQVG